jgi:hypothetical protein
LLLAMRSPLHCMTQRTICATPPAFPATDPMIQKMLASALIAGCAAWLLAAVLHFAFVQKYILLGETYETGEAVHFDAAPTEGAHDHTHDSDAEAHSHEHDEGATSPLTRNALTVLFRGLWPCTHLWHQRWRSAGLALGHCRVRGISACARAWHATGTAGHACA